jgi:amino acid adenylation domain-containing protein
MLSAYYLLLSAYSGQKDVVVGTLTASRGYEEIGEAIGFFVNTLVMRQELNWERTVEDYIRDVGTLVIESEKRGEAPFDRVVEALGIEADRSRHPIFQAAFTAVEAWGDGESLFTEIDGEQGGRYQIAKFDLQMRIAEGKLINGILNYASSLFKHETIERYVANYQLIVLGLLNSRDKRLGELSLLSCDELEQVVYQWNDTCADYSKDRTIIDLFEEQVEKTPDNIAVIYEDKRLTYRELNEEANRMANYLINEYNVCADDIVALCLDRSELMIASIFGVLKAGAAYAPMTPDYPEERLAYMVRDTGTKVILVSERHADKLRKVTDGATAHIEIIDTDLFRKKTGKKTCKNPGRRSAPNNLAYVIYTSGTTGVPKGVMIEQHSVINLVQSVHSRFGLSRDETETILFFTDYVFDMSIRQIFLGLLNGHKLVVTVDNSWMNSASLIELMRKESVTVIISTPSLLQQLDFETVDTLRIVNAGGEAVTKEFFDRMSGKHFKFINAYGPTETTVTAVVNAEGKAAHIGRPIDNTVCYILDESMRPVPVGATGELHIGGVGLARGYLNKPELTAEKFVANPFQTAEEKTRGGNSRLYKTGDLARYLQNGNIEYLGRNDFQVKIRGYRIELGDIESALMTYQSVKQCAVLARERGEAKLLLAYYVGEAKEKELRKYLGEKLPDYMIPSAFVRLEQLPLTVSGKLDRRALPDPDISSEAESYICPANERETELAKIFAEVLGLDFEKLSVNGDFFRLGGDSIRSIKLANRIQRQTGFPITIRDIYTHKTVRNLYRNLIAPSVFGVSMQNEQGILTETLPLFPSQQYFFHQMETSGKPVEVFNSYISSTIVEIASVDEKILWQSLVKLTEYHDAFRLKYHKEISGAVIPYYDDYIDIKLHKFDVSGLDERERKAKISGAAGGWMKTLDIFAGNLCAFGLITGCPDEKGQVHLYVHHLNTDGISWRIVGENLKTIYAYLSEHNGDTPVEMILGPKGTSCRQWITALVADNDSAENERAYWENVVQAGMESDKKLRELLGDTVQNNSFAIDKAPTARIMRASRGGLETRIDDILMTALNVALRNLTGMDSHCVAMVSHGRYNFASDIDVSRTMGFFSFPYPLCLPPVGDDITITFNRVKETLRKVPREGTGACSLWLHKNKTPYLPKIFFNYQGEYDDGVRMDIDAADTGNTVSPHDFDIELIGNVYQGKFYFDLNSKLPEEKAVTFVQNFTAALEYVASL